MFKASLQETGYVYCKILWVEMMRNLNQQIENTPGLTLRNYGDLLQILF